MMQMTGTRDTKRILRWRPTKKCPAAVERLRKRWLDAAIKEITTRKGEDFQDVKELAQDRVAWTPLVRGISSRPYFLLHRVYPYTICLSPLVLHKVQNAILHSTVYSTNTSSIGLAYLLT